MQASQALNDFHLNDRLSRNCPECIEMQASQALNDFHLNDRLSRNCPESIEMQASQALNDFHLKDRLSRNCPRIHRNASLSSLERFSFKRQIVPKLPPNASKCKPLKPWNDFHLNDRLSRNCPECIEMQGNSKQVHHFNTMFISRHCTQ